MQTTNSFWSTYVDLGSSAQRLGQTDLADKMMKAAMDESRRMGYLHMPPPAVFNKMAATFYNSGEIRKAEAIYRSAIAGYERRLTPDHPHLNNVLINLAELYFSQGKYSQAEPLFERALQIYEECQGELSETAHRRILKLAWVYWSIGKHSHTFSLLKRMNIAENEFYDSDHAMAS
ncbi:MAG: tetratricopeptide repeat protein [Candidatus Obscuribacterales bacterium]|jgi:tetratricopeptide (TPR) repeat protein|nr:tetratricopeptide repeat protein [Candidatus Obscuribacterales bacterium]